MPKLSPFLLKNVWNSLDALYALGARDLFVFWVEDEEGKPGDWQKKEHVSKIIKHS